MIPNTLDMHPVLLDRYLEWKFLVNEQIGHQLVLTSVLRTNLEQMAFYSQGRNPLKVTNQYRAAAGMPPIGEKENESQVTWTLNSKHFPDKKTGKGRAFDFALLVPGTKIITWDTKWDTDHDDVPEYLECARMAKECGLEAGGLWKSKPDFPHIQLPADII